MTYHLRVVDRGRERPEGVPRVDAYLEVVHAGAGRSLLLYNTDMLPATVEEHLLALGELGIAVVYEDGSGGLDWTLFPPSYRGPAVEVGAYI